MNKQDLIAKIAQETGITKTNATAAVESFFDGITKSLKKGQPITFVGFGTFKTAQRKARMARNPADRRRDQGSEAPGRPLYRRQGAQGRSQLDGTEKGTGQTRSPVPFSNASLASSCSPFSDCRFLLH